jgi:glycosyltransferase involved in cell wall biosynthesis
LHEVDEHLGEQQFYRTIKVRSLLRNSRAFVVHGQKQKARIQEVWGVPRDHIWLIPLPRLDCLTHYQAHVAQVPYRLLFFGRIYAYKGYDTMLRALPLVAQSFPEVELVIAGEGDLSPWQALIEKAGCHVNVINRFIPDREVLALFRSSVLAVAPYHEASQSGIVSVAMSAGVPVVASKVGTIPEMITDRVTGRLVPRADVPALAEAIIDMLAHPKETERLGETLRKDGEERFSAKLIGAQLHTVYDAVAGNRETGPSREGSRAARGSRPGNLSTESCRH